MLNKRELKHVKKTAEVEGNKFRFWQTPELPWQIPSKYHMDAMKIFHNYQQMAYEEYFFKLFWFTKVLLSYCFCNILK